MNGHDIKEQAKACYLATCPHSGFLLAIANSCNYHVMTSDKMEKFLGSILDGNWRKTVAITDELYSFFKSIPCMPKTKEPKLAEKNFGREHCQGLIKTFLILSVLLH